MTRDQARARAMGLSHYRSCFQQQNPGGWTMSESGLYVLADLRNLARAKLEQVDIEAMAAEERSDRDAYLGHVAQVVMFRYLEARAQVSEDEIDHYERRLRENFSHMGDEG